MPFGRRQLFIYWRTSGVALPFALSALRNWQAGLAVQHPALRCELYQRGGSGDAGPTVMERYAIVSAQPHPGIDDTLQRHIDLTGRAVLQPWLQGDRHVEVFDTLID